jgi:hypothetical protein
MPVPPAYLMLDSWHYHEFFHRCPDTPLHPVIEEIEQYVIARRLDAHPFFATAMTSRSALELWVGQELVMTNAFSQIVLGAAARIQNVHLRAMLTQVAFGEHGLARNRFAPHSHPWLLDRLRDSIDLAEASVAPTPAAVDFLSKLAAASERPVTAIAAIGTGNERLIIPEYAAIKRCFSAVWPDALHEPFLNANINEDTLHSKLCYEIATAMIAMGADALEYRDAAIQSVENRIHYFDQLLHSL